MSSRQNQIVVTGAREHNLKDVTVELPRDSLVVITGLSGSGKSSLAFDTIYAEGQRRYVESLSAYARQFLGQMDKPDVDSIEGLSPAISIDQKTTSRNPRSTVGTVTEIYDYLRLLWARVGKPHCFNCGRPIAAPVGRADHRPDHGHGRGHPLHGHGADRPRPQGRVRQAAAGAALGRLHAREGRRRAAPARGRDRAGQEVQARHLGGRGPPGHAGGHSQAPGGLRGDRGRAGGRDPRGRDRPGRRTSRARPVQAGDPHLLRALRLPALRHLDARARATLVLVQRAARRLPAMHGPRLDDGDRPGAGGAGSVAVDQRGRDPAVVERGDVVLRADRAGDRRALRGRRRRAVGGPAGRGPEPVPVRDQRREAVRLLPQPDGPQAVVHDDLRGHRPQPRAPLQGDGLRLVAGEDRGIHVDAPVPGMRRGAPAAGVARGQGRRHPDPPVHRDERPAGDRVARRARAVQTGPADRPPDPARDRRAAALPGQRGRRLPLDGAGVGDALGRRGAAHPPGDPDRLVAGRRPLHPRRAVDRPAPPRQPAPDRHAGAPARPRQHRAGGRARRGHDARRRLPDRHGPRRRRARRPRRRARHGRGGHAGQGLADRPVPLGHPQDRGAGRASQADRATSKSSARRSTTSRTSPSRCRWAPSRRSRACRARASRR